MPVVETADNSRENLLNNVPLSSSCDTRDHVDICGQASTTTKAIRNLARIKSVLIKNKYNVALIIIFISTFLFVGCILIPCNSYTLRSVNTIKRNYLNREIFSNKTINVAMIGDSQIRFPCLAYNMIGKLHFLLPEYKLAFADYADYGRTIKDINESLAEVLLLKPDAYFLYWDTEVSRYTDYEMSGGQIKEMRAEYRANLISVIKSILATGAYLAVMGPGVLGEGPGIFLPRRFWFKKQMISDYVSMNKDICNEYGVDYIGNYAKSCTLHAHYLSLLCSV